MQQLLDNITFTERNGDMEAVLAISTSVNINEKPMLSNEQRKQKLIEKIVSHLFSETYADLLTIQGQAREAIRGFGPVSKEELRVHTPGLVELEEMAVKAMKNLNPRIQA